jgi:beta-1,2-mannosidase
VLSGEEYVVIYRAQDAQGLSSLGRARSQNGINYTADPEPYLTPTASYETGGGIEDPRVVEIGGVYYLTYTGYDIPSALAQLCLATSSDLITWDRQGVILPAYQGTWNRGWTKSGRPLLISKSHCKAEVIG